jgi:rod shape-determining protein MreC
LRALALLLMVADARFQLMQPPAPRCAVLHPVQRLLLTPVDAWESGRLPARPGARDGRRRPGPPPADRAGRAAVARRGAAEENDRLRKLLGLRPR